MPGPRRFVDLQPGAIVGEYRLGEALGAGGMGVVFEATHQLIDKRVAIKVLHHEQCENREAVDRFLHEARAVNRIGHPNIVDVFGFGTTDDGRAYMVMELLVGESLGARLARSALSLDDVCRVLIEMTHALEAAHAAGIVHRDLKPDNVFLVGDRGVKLLDFGIAKLVIAGERGPVDHTQPGTFVGTPQYMAPEQSRGLPLDGRADTYALGVLAFEMLTGRPPFTSADPVELIAKHITLTPPAPSDFRADLPAAADVLIGEMLAKVPAQRPDMPRVRELLEQVRSAKPSEHARSAAARRRMETEVTGGAAPPAPSKRRWFVPAAIGAVMAGGALAVVAMSSPSSRAARSPTPAPPMPVVSEPVASAPAAPVPPPVAAPVPATPAPASAQKLPPAKVAPTRTQRVRRIPRKPPPAAAVVKSVEDDDALRSPFGSPP